MSTKSRLVLNLDAARVGQLQSLTCNLLPNMVRLETLEDRQYHVVPMVMLTEGVHSGTQGPLLYTKEEMAKTPQIWNHKPVVVYHPSEGQSACDPVIIQNRKVGLIMNASVDKHRLKAEAWIEKDRANKVDDRIMKTIENGEMMELSTGLFVDCEETPGKFGEYDYTGIARNFRPDHLALLPDMLGACSIKKGAGLLRNSQDLKGFPEITKQLVSMGMGHLISRLTGNEMSYGNIQNIIQAELQKRFGYDPQKGPYLWVCDVFSNFFVYEKDGKIFRLGYESTDSGVSLSDKEPVLVRRVTEYRTVDGSYVGNQDHPEVVNNDTVMDKTKRILAILAVANSGWSEADRPVLEKMSDSQLTTVHNGLVPPAPPAAAPPAPAAPAPAPAAPPTVIVNAAPAPAPAPAAPQTAATGNQNQLTAEQYIQNAPPQLREVLNGAIDSLNKEKSQLVDAITANGQNPYTKEELATMTINELRKLSRLAAVPAPQTSYQPSYAGQGSVPVGNTGVEPCLDLPVLTFDKK